jgi:hypothetical protein
MLLWADGSSAFTLQAHALLCSQVLIAGSSNQQYSANTNSQCAQHWHTLANRLTLFLDTIEGVAADVRHSTKAWPVFRKRARQLQIQAQQRLAKQAQLDAASNINSSSTTATTNNSNSTCSSRVPSLAAKLGFSTCVSAMRSAAAAAAAGAAAAAAGAAAAAAAAQSKPAWLKQRGCSKQAAQRADFDNLWKQKASDALNSSSSAKQQQRSGSTTPPLHAVYSRPHVRM